MKHFFSVLLLCLAVNMASCQDAGIKEHATANETQLINRTIPVDEFEKKMASLPYVQLIDVRTPDEYDAGHLKNALNLNIKQDDFDILLNKLDKTKPVFVYCRSGSRSSAAAKKMNEHGFSEIYNMEGGILKWEGANKPVEQAAK